jgi:hypothetical protein
MKAPVFILLIQFVKVFVFNLLCGQLTFVCCDPLWTFLCWTSFRFWGWVWRWWVILHKQPLFNSFFQLLPVGFGTIQNLCIGRHKFQCSPGLSTPFFYSVFIKKLWCQLIDSLVLVRFVAAKVFFQADYTLHFSSLRKQNNVGLQRFKHICAFTVPIFRDKLYECINAGDDCRYELVMNSCAMFPLSWRSVNNSLIFFSLQNTDI